MPSIPLVQRSPLGATFETAQQSGPRVRINTSELTGAYEGLKEAVQTGPRYRAAPNGLPELGQGIEHLGQVGIQLAKQNQQNTDIRKATDAETLMLTSGVELQTKLAESKDPDKFEQIAVDHTSEVLSKLDTEGMSEAQRQHLDGYAKRWKDMAVVKARQASVLQNEKMTVDSLQAKEEMGIMNKDPKAVVEVAQQMERMRVITPEQASERIMKNAMKIRDLNVQDLDKNVDTLLTNGDVHGAKTLIETDRTLQMKDMGPTRENMLAKVDKKVRDTSLANTMVDNPQSFVYALQQKDENGEPKFHKEIKNGFERQDWIDKGMAQIQQNSTEGTFAATRMMADGQMTQEKLNSPEWKSKLTPERHAMLMDTLKKGQPNNPSEWMATAASIDLFQGVDQDSTKLALADMEAVVNTRFQGPYRDSLLAKIKDKANGSDSSAEGPAKKIVAQAFADGELGNYKVPYATKTQEEWHPTWWFIGKKGSTQTVLSPEDQARAAAPDKIGEGWSKQRNPAKLDVGESVVDVRRRDEAAFKMMEINVRLDAMKTAGATPQAMMEYAKQSIQGVRVAPATKQAAPIINSNSASDALFPAGSYEDAVKALEKHATH